MKILLASYWALPHVGGVWTYVDTLQKHLVSLGYEVDILAHAPDAERYYIIHTERSVEKKVIYPIVEQRVNSYFDHKLPDLDRWMRKREIERYCFELGALFLGVTGYDLIHTQDVISTRAIARIKPPGTAHLATIHGSLPHEDILRGGMERGSLAWEYVVAAEHFGTVSSDLTIVPTQWLKNIMIEDIGVPAERMVVIPYGLDIQEFDRRAKSGSSIQKPAGKRVLLCAARLDRIKGQHHLLDALARLKQKRDDWVCWFVGNGYMYEELVKKSRRLGLEKHVKFLGDRSDVPALYQEADVFILPSLQDNQPFVVMEAQVAGKAVVVSNAGGIPEMVIPEQTGLISPSGEYKPLYQNLKRVLKDPDLRQRLGEQAKRWARENWNYRNMLDQTLDLYNRLVSRTGR